MPVTVQSVSDGGGRVAFGYGEHPRASAGYGETAGGCLLTTSAMLNEWPELRGRTIFTEVDVTTGRVRVSYQDPVTYEAGREVRPEPVVVYEGVLGRK